MSSPSSDKKATRGDFFVHTEAVRALSEVLRDTGLTEIDYEHAGVRIRLSKALPSVVYTEAKVSPAVGTSAPMESVSTPDLTPTIKGQPVKSIMVGTVYLCPKPDAPPFVKVGDQVHEGQVILTVEAMKVFNPIKAPCSGTVTHIAVSNGSPVEYGTDLLYIQPS
jgi:acetyl-CoA carboxylase biotin carboxyl carrier protein